jgi:Phosphotransferase enzyme family
VLSAAETRAAEALLARAWGEPAAVLAAEPIWDRGHVVRLRLAGGRTAVLKRRRDPERRDRRSFGAELAALEYLNAMPVPVAPRLLGGDAQARILLVEDLGEGPSLADSLLAGGREAIRAGLIAYAQALGSLHAWSMSQAGGPARPRATRPAVAVPPTGVPPTGWLAAIRQGKQPFLSVAAALDVAAGGVADEIDQLGVLLSGPGYLGLVHGDACPDNLRLIDGACRMIDFETAGWGPVAIDAAYLLAPFPSCWCFARLPAAVAAPAVAAYQSRLGAAGIELGPDWERLTTAALAGLIVARGAGLAAALDSDGEWGTTTMRPRFLAWLSSLAARAGDGSLPRFQATAAAMRDRLAGRWWPWPGRRPGRSAGLAQLRREEAVPGGLSGGGQLVVRGGVEVHRRQRSGGGEHLAHAGADEDIPARPLEQFVAAQPRDVPYRLKAAEQRLVWRRAAPGEAQPVLDEPMAPGRAEMVP